MTWYDFLLKPKEKVSLHQCKRILGQGAFGITYLTPDNLVVKIEAITYNKGGEIGDDFGMNVVPTLDYEVRKHFTQIYGIQYLDYNPLPDLKCIKKITKRLKFFIENDEVEKYKVSIMEYSGEPISSIHFTGELRTESFKQLFNPVCLMLSMGYYHNDLHQGNITYDVNKKLFKIIDYNVMRKFDVNKYIKNGYYFNIRNNLNFLFRLLLNNSFFKDFNIENIKYLGPKKYMKYDSLIMTYELLFYPEKYENFCNIPIKDLPKTFNPKDIMECLYYINSYDFSKNYDETKTLGEYYEEVMKEACFDIALKVSQKLKIEI
jgi:hypothetical protein